VSATQRAARAVRYGSTVLGRLCFLLYITAPVRSFRGIRPLYLLYLDESGEPHGWQDQKHFVLGGVAVHEGQVYGLTRQLDNIQTHFFPGLSVPIVFHATDIRGGKGLFRDLHENKREQLLKELYTCISTARFPNLIAFATAMHVSMAKNHDQVLHDTFQDVCQRFNTFLLRQFKMQRPAKGLLIIDQAHQGNYRELIATFQKTGTQYGYLGNVVDIPYFAKRHDTRMLQLADLCANAVFRYYEKKEAKYFNELLPRFDRRSPGHPADGLKHMTKEPCTCEACSWR